MTIEDQIAALLAQAEPLRLLPDEEQESHGLPGIVDTINALRAEQARTPQVVNASEPDKSAEDASPKRGPGRPRKVEAA